MRRRDLIRELKEKRSRLRRVSASGHIGSSVENAQLKSEKRLTLLHEIETLLPDIIEKLQEPKRWIN